MTRAWRTRRSTLRIMYPQSMADSSTEPTVLQIPICAPPNGVWRVAPLLLRSDQPSPRRAPRSVPLGFTRGEGPTLLVPKQLQRVGMTGMVPHYGGRGRGGLSATATEWPRRPTASEHASRSAWPHGLIARV